MADAIDELARGRASYAARAWSAALDAFSAAERAAPLVAEDLERLATAAYMLGRDEGVGGRRRTRPPSPPRRG